MAFPLFSSARNPIVARARDDSATKLRLRYVPYYHAIEAQQGTNGEQLDRIANAMAYAKKKTLQGRTMR